MTTRTIQTVHQASEVTMTAGFTSFNIGPSNLGRQLDPFVNLDDFTMDRPIFRAHPHAGFSAITYIFEDSPGTFINRWSFGEPELIGPGTFHWTQAGNGMIHEEVPTEWGVDCHGLQMFVRLPTDSELAPPAAFHLDSADVPEHLEPGVRVRVLAGSAFGKESPIAIVSKVTFLNVHLDAGASIKLPAAVEENSFVFAVTGTVVAAGRVVPVHAGATFAHDGEGIALSADEPCELLFGSGLPLNESYSAEGPFMLSTRQRLTEAFDRLRSGGMGSLEPSF
jgi:redox-sensitive bicupin YhaK (pirin superfamily)